MKNQEKMWRLSTFGGFLSLAILPFFSCENQTIEEKNSRLKHFEKFVVISFPKDSMECKVENYPPAEADFYVNSNFFDSQPIGLVVINGKRIQKRRSGGGYFYVKNGRPFVRAKTCPKITEFASQSILWGIDDGNKNIELCAKKHARIPEYRTLLGEFRNGDIVAIASNRFGLVSIEEIIDFALEIGVVEGVLFDGGSSVEYKFSYAGKSFDLKVLSGWMKKMKNIQEPPVFITGTYKR
jgi:hypothetical protein